VNQNSIRALATLKELADTLDASAGPSNVIMQFVESYVAKADAIRGRMVGAEHTRLADFVGSLVRRGGLSSEDAAKVVITWLDNDAAKRVNATEHAARMFEAAIGAIRVIVTDSTLLGMFRGGESTTPPSSEAAPVKAAGEGQN